LKEILKGEENYSDWSSAQNRNLEAPTAVESNRDTAGIIPPEATATTKDPDLSTLPEHPISGAIESEPSTNKYTKNSPDVQGEKYKTVKIGE